MKLKKKPLAAVCIPSPSKPHYWQLLFSFILRLFPFCSPHFNLLFILHHLILGFPESSYHQATSSTHFPLFLIWSLHKIVSILGAPSLRITRKWDSNITRGFFLHQQGEDKDPMSWGLFLRHSALTGWGVWSLCLDKLLSWGGSHQLQLRLTLNPTLQCSQHCQDHILVERQGRALAGAVHFPWEKELFHWNGDAGRESQRMGGGAQGKFKAKQKSSRYQFCKQSV